MLYNVFLWVNLIFNKRWLLVFYMSRIAAVIRYDLKIIITSKLT